MTWLNYITETSWNKHRGTRHNIYKWIHSKVTNTSTLGRYSFDTIFSTGLLLYINWIISSYAYSSLLSLQFIFIFRSGSSLDLDHHGTSSPDLDHHSIWIIIGHHHWIWIITGSGSSLLDHHHWIWIITGSGSSLGLEHLCWIIITGAISWFFSSQEVLQSHPLFMLVVGLPFM